MLFPLNICTVFARSDAAATHHAILCGFYSRAATNWERRLLNSVLSVKSFVNVRALRNANFIRLKKRIAMRWLGFEANLPASWSAAALLQSGTYTAPPIRFLVSRSLSVRVESPWTQTGQKMKKSTASRKVEWLQTPGSQSEETLLRLPCTATDSELEESRPLRRCWRGRRWVGGERTCTGGLLIYCTMRSCNYCTYRVYSLHVLILPFDRVTRFVHERRLIESGVWSS